VREPVLSRYPDFAGLLAAGEDEVMRLRKAEQVGRPIGDTAFLDRLELEAGRSLKPGRPGPKPR
jgi:putative transposase